MRDVIVIGAGGCGPVAAKELAAQGLDVLLLDGGPRHADPRKEWSLLESDANHLLTGYLRAGPEDRSKPAWYRELPQNSLLWQVAGVGGTTKHYFGNCPRAYPGVFNDYNGPDRDNYDVGHRFPFGYRSLVPYYEWVEATLPVHTAPMGTKETVYFAGCETLGLPVQKTKTTTEASYRPQENAILPPGGNAGRTTDPAKLVYPLATGCTMCGHCIQGCMQPIDVPRNQTARRSTDNSYVPMALTADVWSAGGKAVTLITDAMVTKIHTGQVDGQLSATGVTWRDNATGDKHREDARVVILAGGAVESPRLWLNSELPNPNDWVGRGFTDHHLDLIFGVFDDYIGNSKGPHSSARCDFPGYGGLQNVGIGPAVQAYAMAFSESGVRGQYTNGRGFRGIWDGPTGRLGAEELKDVLLHGLDRILNVVTLTDDDVLPDNRVTLSAMSADENGPVPKVRMDQRGRSERSVRNREFLAYRAVELLHGAGAEKVYRMDLAPMLLHVHSTMRMGTDEANSVLDANAESRAVKRLFVADNSALPNSLGGPNPTLTSQALATRTAETIFQTYFGGDAWVRSQAPVVSTDQRITRRLAQLDL
ncbi:MAG: GMC family oxidoreductase [Actinophytocola sp.]|nr:GMC family oxidoreductase [Actinophytocola sp.]